MALLALDASALAAAPQLVADDLDRDMLRCALAGAALAGGGGGGNGGGGAGLQAHLLDLRVPDLGNALSTVAKGAPRAPGAARAAGRTLRARLPPFLLPARRAPPPRRAPSDAPAAPALNPPSPAPRPAQLARRVARGARAGGQPV
jgi:hypothetical protein